MSEVHESPRGDLAEEKNRAAADSSFPVVGIGASAGGLESLERFFSNLRPDPGMAFVVVQHLSPDFRSMMVELLARHSDMSVVVAEHGLAVEQNHVYVLPPRMEITIKGRHLHLREREKRRALALPIDLFFRSLAQDLGPRAIAIVLSGSGSDGSRGIKEVKRGGGMVLVESPESAKFDGMPLSALATGHVDHAASSPELARYITEEHDVDELEDDSQEFVSEPMDAIVKLLNQVCGLDFSTYKRGTIGRRINRRVELGDYASLDEYAARLESDPDELTLLYHDLLIGVTQFFRDPDAFRVIEEKVIPELLDRVPPDEDVRVWVAGCATGEEAYSLAMVLWEQLLARARPLNFKILATDVHRVSLERGSKGYFYREQLELVSAGRRARFFEEAGGAFRVDSELRKRIVFAPHDVTQDAPFTKMHLISCRNLLIYLNQATQKAVLSLFHFGLARRGMLFLGSSESTGALVHEFDAVDEHWKIYRKRRDVRLLDPLRIPLARRSAEARAPSPLLTRGKRDVPETQLLALYDRLLDRYIPPGFLIDEKHELVDSFGGAEQYLQYTRRRPSRRLVELLGGALQVAVAGLLQRAPTNESSSRFAKVPLADEPERELTVSAESFAHPRSSQRYTLITLGDTASAVATARAASEVELDATGASLERQSMLESELAYTRENLQTVVEELQTSNEELQAANEELVASNEELQSTNEELHSVNEELYTVNGEFQKKISELRELNNDMQHLIDGTDVGTLFLDRRLRIRRFTPRVAGVFHLRKGDLGRDISDFAHDLKRDDLLDEIALCLERGEEIEDEVDDIHGTTYFLRIVPYRPYLDGREEAEEEEEDERAAVGVHGVMISLTDISALGEARARITQLSAIVESSDDAILSKDLEGVITTWNGGAERLYGYSAEEMVGRNIKLLAPRGRAEEIDGFLETIAAGGRVEHVETMRVRKDGVVIAVSLTISPLRDAVTGEVVGASAIARDITQLKAAQRELMDREERIRLLLESTAEAIYGIDTDGVCIFCNPACARLLGYASTDELVGQRMHDLVHHSRADGSPYPVERCPIYRVLRTGEGVHIEDEVLFRADGSSFAAEYWSHPIRQDVAVTGAVVTFLDITERLAAKREILEAAERREQFLAMLSHELRNPLAAVLSATQVIKARTDEPVVVKPALEVVERQAGLMARLVDDLLDVSRITRGGIELRKEDLDLRSPIRLAVEAVAPKVAEFEATLEVVLDDAPINVRGDAARLQQIVGNLLTNALKYSPRGSRVELRTERADERVTIVVRDEGDGISSELMPHIFELFVQTEQGIDRHQGGLGVGLALVRQLVGLHGGEVFARSEGLGEGSEFRVTLPLQTHVLVDADVQREEERPAARRVVLVEDQRDARAMMKSLLEMMGHVVFEAADGEEGIEQIERVHPDVALVDIGLPRLDGFGVARAIRKNPVLDDIVLVALTGYGAEDDVTAARAAGFTEHLTKPADVNKLKEILARS